MSAGAWSVKRSLGRCWGFTALSFALYGPYWVYVTRRVLDQELQNGRDDAAFHTVGSFIPILNYFVDYWLWRDIDRLRRSIGLSPFPVGVYVGLTVIGGAPVTYSLVCNHLNEYWDRRSLGWAAEAPVTTGEVLVAVAGAALVMIPIGLLVIFLFLVAAS